MGERREEVQREQEKGEGGEHDWVRKRRCENAVGGGVRWIREGDE